jgi:transposase
MIQMERAVKIRRRYLVGKESIKSLSRELGISRNTVRRIIRNEKVGEEYKREEQPLPKLGKHKEQLEMWLEEDRKLPKKQRCNARKLYERLQEKGYEGAYDSVQRFAKSWHLNKGKTAGQAYVPLYFSPGEAYQFDWSEEVAEIGGIVQTVKAAQFRLCFSRRFIVITYPRETQEMMFDAHDKAFVFFDGLPLRGIYDNLKTAVDTVYRGKERDFNRRFLQMQNHYLVEPIACTPAAGWEKGQIENQVDNIRQWLFVPRLKFPDFETLNAYLWERCLKLAHERKHPDQPSLSIQEVYEQQERHSLRPLIPPFEGYVERTCKVSSTCLVNFDRNHYSVECAYANQAVSLRAYAAKIVIAKDGKVIGRHTRQFGRHKTIYDPWHYVPLLERKPGALRNGAPFKEWNLPTALQKVRDHLMKKKGGDKQCVSILQAIQLFGLEAVTVGCELALEDQVMSADYILNILSRLRPTGACSQNLTPDYLKLTHEPQANCGRYEALIGRSV